MSSDLIYLTQILILSSHPRLQIDEKVLIGIPAEGKRLYELLNLKISVVTNYTTCFGILNGVF
jgi:hypothetical protein